VLTKLPFFQPERIHALLSTLVVPTLTFHRKPIPQPAAVPAPAPPAQPEQPKRSPLLAQHYGTTTPSTEPETTSSDEPTAIFGSVSTTDVLLAVRSDLALDPEASRIPLDARGIRFVGLEAETDRVKSLGEWEVEIDVPGASKFTPEVSVVRRVVKVVAAEEEE